jgi:hypothetical protein
VLYSLLALAGRRIILPTPKLGAGGSARVEQCIGGGVIGFFSVNHSQDNYEGRSLELKAFRDSGAMVRFFTTPFNIRETN